MVSSLVILVTNDVTVKVRRLVVATFKKGWFVLSLSLSLRQQNVGGDKSNA